MKTAIHSERRRSMMRIRRHHPHRRPSPLWIYIKAWAQLGLAAIAILLLAFILFYIANWPEWNYHAPPDQVRRHDPIFPSSD
jgi:hypothetical protein